MLVVKNHTFEAAERPSLMDWLIVGGRDIFGSRLILGFAIFSDVPVPARVRLVDRLAPVVDPCFVIFGFLNSQFMKRNIERTGPSTRMRSNFLVGIIIV